MSGSVWICGTEKKIDMQPEQQLFFFALQYTIGALILFAIIISTAFIHYQIKQSNMATEEQFNALLNRIDAATNDIAAELRSLKDKIAGGGLDAATEAQVLARLGAAADKLENTGKEDVPPEGSGTADTSVPDEGEQPTEQPGDATPSGEQPTT